MRTLAHLLRYDSTFGRYPGRVEVDGDALVIDERRLRATAERDPARLDWAALGVDLVIESTGKFRTRDDAALHLKAGARKVLISAPGKGVDATIVLGRQRRRLRPGAARDRLRRVLHDQLRRADGEGAARGVRRRAGAS